MDFLGCRVFADHLSLNRRSRVRFRRKLRALDLAYQVGGIDELKFQGRATALVAFTRSEGLSTRRFRRRVLEAIREAASEPRRGDRSDSLRKASVAPPGL
jgi:hypothetical protein